MKPVKNNVLDAIINGIFLPILSGTCVKDKEDILQTANKILNLVYNLLCGINAAHIHSFHGYLELWQNKLKFRKIFFHSFYITRGYVVYNIFYAPLLVK